MFLNYANPSDFRSEKGTSELGLVANQARPVRFHAKVKNNIFLVRTALRALGEVIWSAQRWDGDTWFLDPIVTVHDDALHFEGFSADQRCYARLTLERGLFESEGEVKCGTTNVDFTSWLWGALGEMRSSRETWLRLDPAGLEVSTRGGGSRFEKKVDVPDPWLRGFLNLQAAMTFPGTRLRTGAVDLMAPLAFLRKNKARVSPRAIRYQFDPGREARLILEPWEEEFRLEGGEHSYEQPRTVRLWGRRRLTLLTPLLPFTDQVEIYLRGRDMPSFYLLKLPGMEFLLGLSGGSTSWNSQGLDATLAQPDEALVEKALGELEKKQRLTVKELAAALKVDQAQAQAQLSELCRRGLCLYRLEQGTYLHRPLMQEPIKDEVLNPPDPRRDEAEKLVADKLVALDSCAARETRKLKRLKTSQGKETRQIVFRDWVMSGQVAEQAVEVVLSERGQVIFGRCGCKQFKEHLLSQGPCPHMLALLLVGQPHIQDQATSEPGSTGKEEQ